MYWKLLDKCFGIFLPHPSSSPPHPTSTDQRTAWFGPAAASFVVSEFNSNKKHKERNPGMTHIWLLSCDLNLAYVVVISAPVTLVLLRCAQEGKDKQVETLPIGWRHADNTVGPKRRTFATIACFMKSENGGRDVRLDLLTITDTCRENSIHLQNSFRQNAGLKYLPSCPIEKTKNSTYQWTKHNRQRDFLETSIHQEQ